MRDARQQLGREGESLAERFLRSRGYHIVARNVRSPSGELDLIADDGGVLVFVEVKARRTGAFGGTSYAVDPRKQSRIVKQAAQYLARHRIHGRACRFDVVLLRSGAGPDSAVELIQNAFEVPDGYLVP
ncbi:MAG: YraN family protein [Nitrospiraceae bacterium]